MGKDNEKENDDKKESEPTYVVVPPGGRYVGPGSGGGEGGTIVGADERIISAGVGSTVGSSNPLRSGYTGGGGTAEMGQIIVHRDTGIVEQISTVLTPEQAKRIEEGRQKAQEEIAREKASEEAALTYYRSQEEAFKKSGYEVQRGKLGETIATKGGEQVIVTLQGDILKGPKGFKITPGEFERTPSKLIRDVQLSSYEPEKKKELAQITPIEKIKTFEEYQTKPLWEIGLSPREIKVGQLETEYTKLKKTFGTSEITGFVEERKKHYEEHKESILKKTESYESELYKPKPQAGLGAVEATFGFIGFYGLVKPTVSALVYPKESLLGTFQLGKEAYYSVAPTLEEYEQVTIPESKRVTDIFEKESTQYKSYQEFVKDTTAIVSFKTTFLAAPVPTALELLGTAALFKAAELTFIPIKRMPTVKDTTVKKVSAVSEKEVPIEAIFIKDLVRAEAQAKNIVFTEIEVGTQKIPVQIIAPRKAAVIKPLISEAGEEVGFVVNIAEQQRIVAGRKVFDIKVAEERQFTKTTLPEPVELVSEFGKFTIDENALKLNSQIAVKIQSKGITQQYEGIAKGILKQDQERFKGFEMFETGSREYLTVYKGLQLHGAEPKSVVFSGMQEISKKPIIYYERVSPLEYAQHLEDIGKIKFNIGPIEGEALGYRSDFYYDIFQLKAGKSYVHLSLPEIIYKYKGETPEFVLSHELSHVYTRHNAPFFHINLPGYGRGDWIGNLAYKYSPSERFANYIGQEREILGYKIKHKTRPTTFNLLAEKDIASIESGGKTAIVSELKGLEIGKFTKLSTDFEAYKKSQLKKTEELKPEEIEQLFKNLELGTKLKQKQITVTSPAVNKLIMENIGDTIAKSKDIAKPEVKGKSIAKPTVRKESKGILVPRATYSSAFIPKGQTISIPEGETYLPELQGEMATRKAEVRAHLEIGPRIRLSPINRSELKPAIDIKQPLREREITRQGTGLDLDRALEIKPKEELKPKQEIGSRLKQEEILDLDKVTRGFTVPKPKIPPPDVPIFISEFRKPGREPKFSGLYKVFVRRRGLFRPVGVAPTAEKALQRGRLIVGTTAAASFKVQPPSATENILNLARKVLPKKQFYFSRKEPGVFVERREKRIKSPGEKLEITYKGIATQKFRRRKK